MKPIEIFVLSLLVTACGGGGGGGGGGAEPPSERELYPFERCLVRLDAGKCPITEIEHKVPNFESLLK